MRNWLMVGAFVFSNCLAGTAICQELEPAPTAGSVTERAQDLGQKLNESETVREISAGLLQPIYDLAQYMAHPWFYWSAFAVMAAGVVSFVGQLVLTKFLLLFRLKLNLREILSDALGLLISVTGLVLVTQAAAQNSTFTSSPSAVVSAAAVGAIAGLVFWLWGQKTEFQAANDKQPQAPRRDNRPTM